MTARTVLDTPIGPLTLVAEGTTLAAVHLPGAGRPDGGPATGVLADAAAQLEAYFDGTLTEFDLPLAPAKGELAAKVRAALAAVGYGRTCTYGELATAIHGPGVGYEQVRAVGGALAGNPLAIVVPCHRVIGADGGLTGYGGGLERKRFLLDLETPAERRLPTLF
jgi:methylated-DNA-[protein]-cysteine S-methyltransferase